ncbi:MAG: hypothetical protein KF870_12860 [Leadbetterella sp.]|nr:hypothetical protein [Leadbetterella sp.]
MKKILFLGLLTFAALSCDKKDPEAEGTPMERLAGVEAKKWKLTKAVAWSGSLSLDLIANSANKCLGDNELTLRSNNSYILEDTGVKCSTVDRIEDQWIFTESPLQIQLAEISLMDRTFKNVVLDISELKNSSFSGTVNNVPENSLKVNKIDLTFTLVK